MAFQINPKVTSVTISTANTALDGTGSIGTAFTAQNDLKGSILNSMIIQATGDVPVGMIRIFHKPSGGSFVLLQEIPVPDITRTGQYPAFHREISLKKFLAQNDVIGVSTETATSFVVTSFGNDITGFI